MTVADLMATCRWAFAHWGTLPEAIQTDNEPVFVGDTGDLFPGQYTQWLVGLGIEHVTIRPATPSVMRLVDSSAIAGGAFTNVRRTDTESRSIIEDGASKYPMRIPGAMLLPVLVM